MKRPLILALASLVFAPADAVHGAEPTAGIAEIVRFRLNDGVTDAGFLDATRRMQPVVEAAPGYVSRRLSKNADGSWTDYVVWTDLANAQSAATTIFENPEAEAFGKAIDPASVDMRHETILMQME